MNLVSVAFSKSVSAHRPLAWSRMLLLSIVICYTAAIAERKPIAFGLLGGITGTTLWGKDIDEPDAKIWLTTGLSLAFHLPAFIGVETDLLYVGKSATYNQVLPDQSTQVNKVSAQTLEMPLMLKVTVPTESEVQPVIYGGWSVARWISSDFTSETISTGPGGMIIPQELKPEIAKADLPDWEQSLVIGGGVEWGLGTFQARFSLGQNSIDGSGRLDIKTLITTVMAGFIF
jgi:hypothetical protein